MPVPPPLATAHVPAGPAGGPRVGKPGLECGHGHPPAPPLSSILRLLADDLTGALDSAAELVWLCGPVQVPLRRVLPADGSLALDSASREATRAEAVARVAALAPALAGGSIAFKKIDSLLRGHVAAELAACLASGRWRHCILAPAFPAMGRQTREGRQWVRQPGGDWAPAGPADLPAMLAEAGLSCALADPRAPLPDGIAVLDARTEADLARIAALGRAAAGPVLWCGTGGLAGALAGGARVRLQSGMQRPVLGLFGSDHATTARQLAACGSAAIRVAEAGEAARIAALLDRAGLALVSPDLPAGLSRAAAAEAIAVLFAGLLRRLPRPGTLVVAGGETLRAVCGALGARALLATGLAAPGVPRASLVGGPWDGLALITKSGVFGGDGLWRDLLAANGLPDGSEDA